MKTNKNAVIIRERVYIPTHLVDTKFVKSNYVTRMYEDRACAKCAHFADRHSYLCDECPAYLGKVVLHAPKMVKGVSYIGIPVGDKLNFERKTGLLFSETEFIDRRVTAPFAFKIKFLASLRDYQTPVVEQFLAKKYGLLEAPPRTGKTLMALYICLKLGQRTLMLANQHEFLTQFIDHIQGNEAEEIPKCTNLPELQSKAGKKLYGFPKTDADFENFQFFTMTYQQFLSEQRGLDRFRKIAKQVGTIFIDECFTYGHRVKTDKGLLSLGDIVTGKVTPTTALSYNESTGKSEMRLIESLTAKKTKRLCKVTISGTPYICTPSHEFYVDGKGYVKAADLTAGDIVLNP